MNNDAKILKYFLQALFAVTVTIAGGVNAMAVEEAAYTVLKKDGVFEIRDYAPHFLAETIVEGDLESAGNTAFRTLFNYISGNNRSQGKVAMTAPVSQEPAGEKIRMTAPVEQQSVRGKWAVSFTMPATLTLETLPEPLDPNITLRMVPARRMAAVRYSGTWSKENYHRHLAKLQTWLQTQDITTAGEPVWARYNPPFTPWFLRRNEILIPVQGGD